MNNNHPISDEVLELASIALSKGKHWMAFNQSLYFIDKNEVHFFESKQEATTFAIDNYSDRDNYKAIPFDSLQDIFKRIPYNENLGKETVNDPDANGLYNHDGNDFTDALIDHIEKQQSFFNSQLKSTIMNTENLQYLGDNIKYLGFGENLKPELEKNLKEGKETFQLNYKAEINKQPFEATLNFRKSTSTDMYFLNNFHASIEKANNEKTERTFFLNKGKGITSKEAFNLLEGRAVHKELYTKENQPYTAWVQLDFNNKDKNNNFEVKQYHENYGFDLKHAVEKFAIVELRDADKEKTLLQSLQKGNVQSVTIEKDGSSQKMFVEADPQFKKVNVYDASMKLITKESIEKYQVQIQPTSSSIKENSEMDKKKDLKQEVKAGSEKLNKKSDSLLPKKRVNQSKGLGIS